MKYNKIISKCREIREILNKIDKIAPLDVPVLLIGETGTGKDFFANLIHVKGRGEDKPFVIVDCSLLEENLADSDLFGHEKGAFTGAEEKRIGKFEIANGGTIYFDRINLLPLTLQGKLLRVLEDRFIFRLGGDEKIEINSRVIASSDEEIFEMVKNGNFRKDLFFRLDVFTIRIPPLRERRDEIIDFWNLFKFEIEKETGIKRELTPGAKKIIKNHSWHGNIRELRMAVKRVWLNDKDKYIKAFELNFLKEDEIYKNKFYNNMLPLREMIKKYVREVWEKMGKNATKTAKVLGITRKTLKSWLKK
ncbi:MAG: sigma-54-dependent transcriptional regulator [Candidatus Aminicenantia bacterium]